MYGAEATLTAVMGRMANYTGKEVTREFALDSKDILNPEKYAWNAKPPTTPDGDGKYPIPMPGITKLI